MILSKYFLKEITGPTCSGKSLFIADYISCKVPYSYFFVGFFYLIFANFNFFTWISKKCLSSDYNLISCFIVFVNVFAKFGKSYVTINKKKTNTTTVIDEGLSHIPFILMLSESEIDYFIKSSFTLLSRTLIYFKYASYSDISSRLKKRGHKRVRNTKDFMFFLENHYRVQNEYYFLLIKNGLTCEKI